MSTEPETRNPKPETLFLGAILFLGFALRLYHITAPPTDFLSWRDTQTLMIARNFFREGMNLFAPMVDWRAVSHPEMGGLVGATELQVVPYLTAMLYFVFGIASWVGRAVPIAFALIGTAYFYRLVQRFYGTACAAMSALLLTVSPYFLYCGRVQMPEPFVYAMAFAALYHYDTWLESSRRRGFWLAAVFTSLTLLGKPQLAIIAIPMAFLTFRRHGRSTFTTWPLYAFAALVALPVGAYVAYSYGYLGSRTAITFAQDSLLDYRRYLFDPKYYIEVAKAVWNIALTPPVVVLAVLGLAIPGPKGRDWFAHAWLAGALSFFLLMPGGNITNGYYHLVLAPPCAILASRALSACMRGKAWRIAGLAALIGTMAWSLYVAKDLYTPYHASELHCGAWIDQNTPRDARVLTASRSPATLYFADRIGWTSWRETFGVDLINKVIPQGASVLAVTDGWFDNAYFPEYQGIRDTLYDTYACYHDPDFAVFWLTQPADLALPEDGRLVFGIPGTRKFLRGTWGPNQESSQGGTFVAMGPSRHAVLVFSAARRPGQIAVELASAVPDQTVTIALNGASDATLQIPRAFERGTAVIDCAGIQASNDRWIVSFDVSRQNEQGAGLVLYAVTAR